jgi:hypothetical protein
MENFNGQHCNPFLKQVQDKLASRLCRDRQGEILVVVSLSLSKTALNLYFSILFQFA